MKDQREKINRIDKELAELLDKRMELAEEIGKIKKEKALPVYDARREKEVFDNLAELPKKSIEDEELREIFKHIILISRRHGEKGMC
ncbi:MAG: chorismate mutase [Candidatus Marinimicrobia bacterium]|nr:chorismate mutase [Candidatus Neomarinimicrobiota bacterium]